MKKILLVTGLFSFLTINAFAQCDPATVAHYNFGDFPFTSSTGVTVSMGGTNSGVLGPYGPYGCSAATCEVNTIRLDPGDTTVFTFDMPVTELTFIAGVMNTTENGAIITNGGATTLTSNCPADLQITGTAFVNNGALASPVVTVTVPAGMTEMRVTSLPASNNGVWTVDLLDCITPGQPCTPTSSNVTLSACDSYLSPAGNTYTSNGTYYDTIPNAGGCDSIITTMLTINSVDNTVAQNGATLTSNETNATYQWLNCDSSYTAVSGETNISFTPATTGYYAVQVIQGACTDTSACLLVDYTGINELPINPDKELVKIIDFMGRETIFKPGIPLIYVYSDGTFERLMVIED